MKNIFRKNHIKKAIRPSERESITDFSSSFGPNPDYEEKVRRRRIITTILCIAAIIAVISVGYIITETLIDITELPY